MKRTHWIAIIIGVVTALGIFSCAKPEGRSLYCDMPPKVDCTEDTNYVNMRVINKTDYPLCEVKVRYAHQNPTYHEYGTLDPDEFSCYSAMTVVNYYPEVTFKLGTAEFTVIDSLITNSKYNSLYLSSKGYYSLFIDVAPFLDSHLIITTIVPEF